MGLLYGIFLIGLFFHQEMQSALPSQAQLHVSLHELVRNNNVFEVRRLLQENHTIINRSNKSGKTPLQIAAQAGDNFMIKLLLEFGASINYRTVHGTALSVAVAHRQLSTVQLLLERGADPNLGNKDGAHIPLDQATQASNVEMVALLQDAMSQRSQKESELSCKRHRFDDENLK